MQTPLTIGWWNEFAAASCGQPMVLAVVDSDVMAVHLEPDLSVTVRVWRDQLQVPCQLVRPLLGALIHLDTMNSPVLYHHVVGPDLSLEMQSDATVVIVIGADDEPCHAIEIPAGQVEQLKQALQAILT